MRKIPIPQNGDRLDAEYLQRMLLAPTSEEFRNLRRAIMPTGLYRPRGSRRFNEHRPTIERILSRVPLTVLVACPATCGIDPNGEYIETEPFEGEVVLSTRGDFSLHLAPATPSLSNTPVAPAVLLDEKYAISTRGGLMIAHGVVGPDFEPVLDSDFIPPTATIGGSRAVQDAVSRLRSRVKALDRHILISAATDQARTLLMRWSAFYAPWRGLGEMTALDEYVVQTTELLSQMIADTASIFGASCEDPAGDRNSIAGTFRQFEVAVDGLAVEWQRLLQAPMTAEIALVNPPSLKSAGSHNEIVLEAQQKPIPFATIEFKARFSGSFRTEVASVYADLSKPHTTIGKSSPRAELTTATPGAVGCRIDLTPEERLQGRLRLFVRRELSLSFITITGG